MADLAVYDDLIDLCRERGFRYHLDWGKEGWTLDVFEKGDLIARGTSSEGVPRCFQELAGRAFRVLATSGRA